MLSQEYQNCRTIIIGVAAGASILSFGVPFTVEDLQNAYDNAMFEAAGTRHRLKNRDLIRNELCRECCNCCDDCDNCACKAQSRVVINGYYTREIEIYTGNSVETVLLTVCQIEFRCDRCNWVTYRTVLPEFLVLYSRKLLSDQIWVLKDAFTKDVEREAKKNEHAEDTTSAKVADPETKTASPEMNACGTSRF